MLTLKKKATRILVLGILALGLIGTPLVVSTNTAYATPIGGEGGHTGG